MLVSHRKRFIYTKTVKTGGTSVEVYFEPYCFPTGAYVFSHARDEHVAPEGIVGFRGPNPGQKQVTWFNHMSAEAIREKLGEAMWNAYFKFCVIRDPFDKVVSAFHFFALRREACNGMAFEEIKRRFKEWVKAGKLGIDRDKYLIGGEVCVDYFLRHETLAEGIREVCMRLEIPFEPSRLLHLKKGTRPDAHHFRDYYDRESAETVARHFDFEIRHFGYRLPVE